jgi:uncharacterized membrane protein
MIELLLPAAALANGLCAGVLVASVLGVVPYYRTLPADGYIRAHAFSVGRYDPFQPVCLLITLVADAAAAIWADDGAARLLCAAAAVLVLAVLAVTLARNLPMNRSIQRVVPDAPPEGFVAGAFLRSWARWNAVRTAFAALALLANAAAIGVLL